MKNIKLVLFFFCFAALANLNVFGQTSEVLLHVKDIEISTEHTIRISMKYSDFIKSGFKKQFIFSYKKPDSHNWHESGITPEQSLINTHDPYTFDVARLFKDKFIDMYGFDIYVYEGSERVNYISNYMYNPWNNEKIGFDIYDMVVKILEPESELKKLVQKSNRVLFVPYYSYIENKKSRVFFSTAIIEITFVD